MNRKIFVAAMAAILLLLMSGSSVGTAPGNLKRDPFYSIWLFTNKATITSITIKETNKLTSYILPLLPNQQEVEMGVKDKINVKFTGGSRLQNTLELWALTGEEKSNFNKTLKKDTIREKQFILSTKYESDAKIDLSTIEDQTGLTLSTKCSCPTDGKPPLNCRSKECWKKYKASKWPGNGTKLINYANYIKSLQNNKVYLIIESKKREGTWLDSAPIEVVLEKEEEIKKEEKEIKACKDCANCGNLLGCLTCIQKCKFMEPIKSIIKEE